MKNQKLLNLLKFVKDYAMPITGAIFTILNIYLTLKLSPIIYDIKTLVSRVDAVEESVTINQSQCESNIKNTNDNLQKAIEDRNQKLDKILDNMTSINTRLSRMEGKLGIN